MKIVIFPSSYFPVLGGVQEVAFRLAKEFKKKGHNMAVITQRYPRTLKKKGYIRISQCVNWPEAKYSVSSMRI
jgi:glycogen synthase